MWVHDTSWRGPRFQKKPFGMPRKKKFLASCLWLGGVSRQRPDCSSNLCPPKTIAIWLLGGVLGLLPVLCSHINGPKHTLKMSDSKCFTRTQIRWVIWRSYSFHKLPKGPRRTKKILRVVNWLRVVSLLSHCDFAIVAHLARNPFSWELQTFSSQFEGFAA